MQQRTRPCVRAKRYSSDDPYVSAPWAPGPGVLKKAELSLAKFVCVTPTEVQTEKRIVSKLPSSSLLP